MFHGTRFARHILRDNELAATTNDDAVYFTRRPDLAYRHALLPKYDFDEGRGAVFVLDRDRLAKDYRLEKSANKRRRRRSEGADETILGPVTDLSIYVVGVFRLEDVAPGLGICDPRTPHGEPYVPVAKATRRLLAERLDALSLSLPSRRAREAIKALKDEIEAAAFNDWPLLVRGREFA